MVDDHTAVVGALYQYAYGIDARDWDLYRSLFADRVMIDFSSYNGRPASEMAADDWVEHIRPLFTGLDATQHSMSNPVVTVDGVRAHCRMYVQAAHFLTSDPEPEFTIGGYYHDGLVRSGGGWLIDSVTEVVWWRRGNPQIMEEAKLRGAHADT